MINNLGDIIAEVQKIQDGLKNMTTEVSEGEGAVKIVINGYQEVLAVLFDPSILNPANKDDLQVTVAKAINRAVAESKQMVKSEIGKLTGGMNLPNINGLF